MDVRLTGELASPSSTGLSSPSIGYFEDAQLAQLLHSNSKNLDFKNSSLFPQRRRLPSPRHIKTTGDPIQLRAKRNPVDVLLRFSKEKSDAVPRSCVPAFVRPSVFSGGGLSPLPNVFGRTASPKQEQSRILEDVETLKRKFPVKLAGGIPFLLSKETPLSIGEALSLYSCVVGPQKSATKTGVARLIWTLLKKVDSTVSQFAREKARILVHLEAANKQLGQTKPEEKTSFLLKEFKLTSCAKKQKLLFKPVSLAKYRKLLADVGTLEEEKRVLATGLQKAVIEREAAVGRARELQLEIGQIKRTAQPSSVIQGRRRLPNEGTADAMQDQLRSLEASVLTEKRRADKMCANNRKLGEVVSDLNRKVRYNTDDRLRKLKEENKKLKAELGSLEFRLCLAEEETKQRRLHDVSQDPFTYSTHSHHSISASGADGSDFAEEGVGEGVNVTERRGRKTSSSVRRSKRQFVCSCSRPDCRLPADTDCPFGLSPGCCLRVNGDCGLHPPESVPEVIVAYSQLDNRKNSWAPNACLRESPLVVDDVQFEEEFEVETNFEDELEDGEMEASGALGFGTTSTGSSAVFSPSQIIG